MKKLIIIGALLLSACSPSTEQLHGYVLPPELHDCKIYRMLDDIGNPLRIVYCPQQSCTSSSYQSGNTTKHEAICK